METSRYFLLHYLTFARLRFKRFDSLTFGEPEIISDTDIKIFDGLKALPSFMRFFIIYHIGVLRTTTDRRSKLYQLYPC